MSHFEINLSKVNYSRFKSYYNQITDNLDKVSTVHWSKREKQNFDSFKFLSNCKINVNNNNNSGLDDNYMECFFKNKIETKLNPKLKHKIKKKLLNILNVHTGLNFDANYSFKTSENNEPLGVDFIKNEFGLKRNDFTIFKSIYILNDLYKSIDFFNLDNKNILEIGPGVGNLMRSIFAKYKNAKLFLVDLDISLLYSILNILYRFPTANYLLPNEVNASKDLNLKNLDFIFLTHKQIDLIPSHIINNAFNTMSFQEMTMNEINKYFNLLRRVLTKDNYFYCLNAVEKEMVFDNKKSFIRFSEYPWSTEDVTLKFNLSNVHKNKTTKAFFRKIINMGIND